MFYNIVLPVGISFYTFQSMSYSIDLYRGHARPAPDFLSFACYVSMFPQLVAGPIVRYGSVADQIRHRVHTRRGLHLRAGALQPRLRQEDPARQPDGRHRRRLLPGRRRLARHPRRLARRVRLRLPDLLRFLRVFRHGDRARADVRVPFPGELRLALQDRNRSPSSGAAGTSRCRASCATTSTSRWGATAGAAPHLCEPDHRHAARRALARRAVHLHHLGGDPRRQCSPPSG